MAEALAAVEDHDTALEAQDRDEDALDEVFNRATVRFDLAVIPQLEQRSLALAARRFIAIPGAMWEGDFGAPFDEAFKLEVNLTSDGLEKIYRDYNENRIVPDFRPAGGKGDEDSAATLDALHRADSHCFKSQQARDNAFYESSAGGFGAYRLTNEWADPYDKDSDQQRINPGLAIVDADQRVFFDPDSTLYDKSDAKYAFVITSKAREQFEDDNPDAIANWSDLPDYEPKYDWFSPDVVKVAEYYEVEDVTEKLYVLTHVLSGEEQRYWESEIDPDELKDLRRMGWQVKTRELERRRVHKYVLSGAEVLEDQGIIAGDRIPIVPVYGRRAYVDGVERFKGYVQDRMDRNRLYNMAVSKLAETSAQSPRGIPIFAPQQMPPHLADQWANQVVERHAYALVEPLYNPTSGELISAGPVATVEPAQVDQATAAVLQLVRSDLVEDQQDGSEQAKANTSEEALAFAATRVDAKSGLYLESMRQSVECEGEIYLSMCADVYYEPGREVETMTEDGNDGTATLVENYVDPKGVSRYRNDFTRGHYKVVASVTEATATRRDKTVKASLGVAAVAVQAGDEELGQVAILTAVMNQDGEGMPSFQKYARRRLVAMGVEEPTDEEKAAMEEAQQNQAPDAATQVAEAQADALHAGADEARARTDKAVADTKLSEAKTVETLAKAEHERQKPRLSIFQRWFGQRQAGQRPQR